MKKYLFLSLNRFMLINLKRCILVNMKRSISISLKRSANKKINKCPLNSPEQQSLMKMQLNMSSIKMHPIIPADKYQLIRN